MVDFSVFGLPAVMSWFIVGVAAIAVAATWPIAGALTARTVAVEKGIPGAVFLASGWLGLLFYASVVFPALGVCEIGGWVADWVTWRWQRILSWYEVQIARIAPDYFPAPTHILAKQAGGFLRTHGGAGFVLVAR